MGITKRSTERKQEYFGRLLQLLDEYPKILVCGVDHVGSNHMQQIRSSLRGDAVILMGKNTMIRKAIRGHIQKNPKLEALLPYVRLNIGFVFTKGDLGKLKKKVAENRVGAPAKAGIIAPSDVIVPAGDTGMEPTQTSFLQALNIASKINKGQIQIVNDVFLIKQGEKVTASQAALLQKLDIKPFSYGLEVTHVYDEGFIYSPVVLDLTDEQMLKSVRTGIANIAAISLATGFATAPAVPHVLLNGVKNLIAISLATDFKIAAAQSARDFLADPSAFAAAAPAAATTSAAGGKAKVEEKPAEPEEVSDEDMGFGLFD